MIGSCISHFRIVEQIAQGGMGVVYRAHDEVLRRDVALKLITEEVVAGTGGRSRLLREARLASSLNHPNICTVFEVGEFEGRGFIAMELVEGRPLHALVPAGGMPIDQVIHYGVQIAEALEHAHDNAVIHRDLKTSNVVVTKAGRAKVLDFGLARHELSAADAGSTPSLAVTQSGVIAGTPHYLAPEVLLGGKADARSDLWALGVMLHEMCSGSPPFHGPTVLALFNAIINDPPATLSDHVPVGLRSVIRRLLAKNPGERYSRAGEVKAALEVLSPHPSSAGARTARAGGRRVGRTWALSGAALVLLAALAYLRMGGFSFGSPPAGHIRSLAVLPLANLSGDATQEYFADGMTEELITQLAPIESLTVISRTSSMEYKDTKKKLPEIARELHVDGIVEGTVYRDKNYVRITVRLLDGPRDKQLWAESYKREIQDVIQLQRELARDITRKIQLRLSAAQSARLAALAVVDPEAYELYLRGRFEWSRMTDASVREAIRYYEQSIVRNPNDARPDAGIAYAYLVLAHMVRTMSCLEALPQAHEHAEKALALDSTSAEAQTAMGGSLIFYEHDWAEAERRARLATQLNSGYPGGHLVYAILLGAEGRYPEALVHSDRAMELDPRFLIYSYNRAWQSYLMHQFDQASLQASKTLDIEPRFPPAIELLVRIQESRGHYREAIRRWRSMEALGMPAAVGDALDQSYQAAGARGYWQAQLQLAQRRRIGLRHSNTWIASVYSALGERDSAFAALDRAYVALESDLIFCRADPALDSLRDDPRMAALIRRMGLTP
jgi:TolB-like protein/Tfp pilus assembly protein PilF